MKRCTKTIIHFELYSPFSMTAVNDLAMKAWEIGVKEITLVLDDQVKTDKKIKFYNTDFMKVNIKFDRPKRKGKK